MEKKNAHTASQSQGANDVQGILVFTSENVLVIFPHKNEKISNDNGPLRQAACMGVTCTTTLLR